MSVYFNVLQAIVYTLRWDLAANYPTQQVTLHPFAVTPPCSNPLMNEASGGSVYYTPITPQMCLTWSCKNLEGWAAVSGFRITSNVQKNGGNKTFSFFFYDGGSPYGSHLI